MSCENAEDLANISGKGLFQFSEMAINTSEDAINSFEFCLEWQERQTKFGHDHCFGQQYHRTICNIR